MIMHKIICMFFLICISTKCYCIDDFDLEFYINPTSKIEPIERYGKKYDWDNDLAGRMWLHDNRKARETHRENIQQYTEELIEKIRKTIYYYNKPDYFENKLIGASIKKHLEENIGTKTCNIKNITDFTRKNLYFLCSIKNQIYWQKNKFILEQSKIDKIREYHKKLEDLSLDYVINLHQERNFFYEYGVSEYSVYQIIYPLTEKQIEHLNVDVGDIKKLASTFQSLKEADEDNYYSSLIAPSIKGFLEKKGWGLNDIKKASELTRDLDNSGFYFCDEDFWSSSKMWCWEIYKNEKFLGWFLWWFYGTWID